jgi:lysophospholipase L1-like esterase
LGTARRLGMATLVCVSAFALIEGGVRTTGVVRGEILPSPLSFQSVPRNIRADGSTPESFVYQMGRPREVLVQPAGIRVLVLGGSAVHGNSYPPFAAFVGQLDRHLNRAFEGPVEVINLGISGIGIRHVRVLVGLALDVDKPDLIVIYSGNNEFHELRVHKSIDPDFDSRVWLARRSLFELHLYRLMRGVLAGLTRSGEEDGAPKRQPMTNMEKTFWEITIGDDDRELVNTLYGQELAEIVRVVERAGVPLMLSTVANNLRWCSARGGQVHLSDANRQILARIDHPSTRGSNAGDGKRTTASGEATLSAHDLCVAGNRLAEDGKTAEAFSLLEAAEYWSPRPFRSNVVQRQMVRRVATEANVGLCDVAAGVNELSPGGLPGRDVFDDSCHPNALGHRRIGAILARCILEQGLLGSRRAPDEIASLELMAYDELESDVFRLDRWMQSSNPSVKVPLPPSDDSPESAAEAGHRAVIAAHFDLAIDYYRLAIERGGPAPDLGVSVALTKLYAADIDGARAALDQALSSLGEEPYLRDLRSTL